MKLYARDLSTLSKLLDEAKSLGSQDDEVQMPIGRGAVSDTVSLPEDLLSALSVLDAYNLEYLQRSREGRKKRFMTPVEVELEHRYALASTNNITAVQTRLRQSMVAVATSPLCHGITLGIMCQNKDQAMSVLQRWVPGLGMEKGVLLAYDKDDIQVEVNSFPADTQVYVKYYSKDSHAQEGRSGVLAGDAYMKPYSGDMCGVIFQPSMADGQFRQMGDFWLDLF